MLAFVFATPNESTVIPDEARSRHCATTLFWKRSCTCTGWPRVNGEGGVIAITPRLGPFRQRHHLRHGSEVLPVDDRSNRAAAHVGRGWIGGEEDKHSAVIEAE